METITLNDLLQGLGVKLMEAVIVMILVLVAMTADLTAGLYKAKMRGEYRSSELLKRTGAKFALYEGTLLIAVCIDIMLHLTHIMQLLGVEILHYVPLVTILMGVFWCVVEVMSIREKSDEKTRKKIQQAEEVIIKAATDKALSAALQDALRTVIAHSKEGGSDE